MKLILLGAPGSGKGTQAEHLSRRLDIPAISTGQMLREAIAAGTELGKKARLFVESGGLVPDDIMIGLIQERVTQNDCQKGFILDGFPRTIPQAEALDCAVGIDAVLSIEIADEEIERRMSGRRSCPKCGASYHMEYRQPRQDGVCDNCGSALERRADDEPETVRVRLETYHENTAPLKGYYARMGKLKSAVSQHAIEDTSQRCLGALGL
ncbi:MAG: adenylate kinase [Oscillospiraceae bacterium]|nr:adenylate kinase [Oscillospiraceae bacterium]